MCDIENRRQAAGFAIGVSNQLMAAALAMLAILGAVLVFVLDKREITRSGLLTVIAAFLCFICCIGVGAKGVAKIYQKGSTGSWSYENGDPWFQCQVGFALLGLVLFPLGVALMPEVRNEVEIRSLIHSVDSLRNATTRMDLKLRRSQVTLDSIFQASLGASTRTSPPTSGPR